MLSNTTDPQPLVEIISKSFTAVVGELAHTAASLRNVSPASLIEQSFQASKALKAMRAEIGGTLVELPNGKEISLGDHQALVELARLNGCNEQEVFDGAWEVTERRVTSFQLENNRLTDVSPLAALTELHWLILCGNQITDATPLAALTNLQVLHLNGNHLTETTPLAVLTNLHKLYLKDNQITNASPLARLANLRRLTLSGNRITEVSPLTALRKLEWLYLSSNQLTDASPLAVLTNLRCLALSANQLTCASPLTALTNLRKLYLDGNPLNPASRGILEALRSRGVEVYD